MRPFVEANQAIVELSTRTEFMDDPTYYDRVIQPAMDKVKFAIALEKP